jgi:murein DD-endopeptidase MepM/ murein hydrolase activator NlpD
MGNSKFCYNPETCQYERAKITFSSVLLYGTGVIATGCLLFGGMMFIADQVVQTEKEKFLAAENDALTRHKFVLASRLSEVESAIDDLHRKDIMIYEKLFEVKPLSVPQNKTHRNNSILSADNEEFDDQLSELKHTAEKLQRNSQQVNRAFGRRFRGATDDNALLQSVPTLQPIANSNLDFVVSGFGVRINPFHKGKYMHPGIDFAAPRGTTVVATAPGKIVQARSSNLKAGYGSYVEIDHGHGLVTRYAHLENVDVRPGERVAKGHPIGTVGNTGGSIAPHLHYEVMRDKENVDPMIYMVEGLSSQDYNRLSASCGIQNQSLD